MCVVIFSLNPDSHTNSLTLFTFFQRVFMVFVCANFIFGFCFALFRIDLTHSACYFFSFTKKKQTDFTFLLSIRCIFFGTKLLCDFPTIKFNGLVGWLVGWLAGWLGFYIAIAIAAMCVIHFTIAIPLHFGNLKRSK